MQKNVAAQKLIVFAFNSTTNAPVTGDAANILAYVSIDYGAVTAIGDTSATEMDATNAKGYYLFDLTQAETNGNTLLFSAKSSTANVVVVGAPAAIQTVPAAFVIAGGAAGGLFIAGTNAATTVTTAFTSTFTGNLTGSAGSVTGAVGSVAAGGIAATSFAAGAINAAAIDADAITAAKVAADVSAEISSAVWSETFRTLTSIGPVELSATSLDDIWAWEVVEIDAAGSIGVHILDNLNATVSSRATQTSLDTVDNFIDTEIADIQSRLPAALVSGRMDSSVGAMAANTMTAAAAAADLTTELQSGLATAASIAALNNLSSTDVATAVWNAATATYGAAGSYGLLVETNLDAPVSTVDTVVDAIKAKTDQLTFGVANTLNANITYVNEIEVAGNGEDATPWNPV